ncbi:MAG TPA: hypothetical protein VN541_06175 [Tepidisphaeraceae bacterium]|nr:hypothetical protein [Tepidisphaeraceae bacterium]
MGMALSHNLGEIPVFGNHVTGRHFHRDMSRPKYDKGGTLSHSQLDEIYPGIPLVLRGEHVSG